MQDEAPPLWPEPVKAALRLPAGAQFYRCALQVNPWAYLDRQGKQTTFPDEQSYNAALVQACRDTGTTVVGLADHHSVDTSESLRAELGAAGVHVFPGFEVTSSEGVQAVVLFDADVTEQRLTLRLGELGADPEDANGLAAVAFRGLLGLAESWGAVVVAGQLTYDSGLLKHLHGRPRIAAWKDPRLLAGAIPSPVHDIKDQCFERILRNDERDYKREFPVALVHANDVCGPADLEKSNTWTWIKMTSPAVAGLRAAFRDPGSRVRLPSEPLPTDHPHIVAVGWEGAKSHLGGSVLRLSADLNVLVGGRGAGKSTIVESIRFVLGQRPTGRDSTSTHDNTVRDALGTATRVWTVVRSTAVEPRSYLVERVVGGAPTVTDEQGRRLAVSPVDVFPGTEVWGQREIAELADRDAGTHRNRLLQRLAPLPPEHPARKRELARQLEENRVRLSSVRADAAALQDRIAALPALEEQASRYAAAGVENRLREQALLVREDKLLEIAGERLSALDPALARTADSFRPDAAFLSAALSDDLPDIDLLAELQAVLRELTESSRQHLDALHEIADRALRRRLDIQRRWQARTDEARTAYEQRLRELQGSGTDGTAYLELRRTLESLGPLRTRLQVLEAEQEVLADQRRQLLDEWDSVREEELATLQRAATQVDAALSESVRVTVVADGDTGPLEQLLRDTIGGNLGKTVTSVAGRAPRKLADMCRGGPAAVQRALETTPRQAEKICAAGPDLFEQIEQLDLSPTTDVKLKVGPEWRKQDRLSKGQQATAFLLLLLLGSELSGPLVVDQPEEDLDNRFITDSIVPAVRAEKLRRQFVFASHNPNIPVLGDAELIAEVRTELRGERVTGRVGPPAVVGSIDATNVRQLVEETLEGGERAFATRRRKYGV